MSVKSKLVTIGDTANAVVVLDDGTVLVADHNHARFDEISQRIVEQNWDGIEKVFSVGSGIVTEFEKIGTRVTIRQDKLFFEGEELDDSLSDLIVRLYNDGEDYEPFLEFLEKLRNNPNGHSVENLFRWLHNGSFAIDWEGNILAYKGVNDDLTSRTAGPAIHNGKPFNGNIPNNIGDMIEMDRGQVQHNPSVGCSVGLHAGTWDYARGFGPKVVLVQIDPRDVVSVPTDCNDQKMRVCRYIVVDIAENELESALYGVKVPVDEVSDDSVSFVADDPEFNVGDRVRVPGDRVGVIDEIDFDNDVWIVFEDGDEDGWYDFAELEHDLIEAEPESDKLTIGAYVKVLESALENDHVLDELVGQVGQVAAIIDYGTQRGVMVKVKFDDGERAWIMESHLQVVHHAAPSKVDTTQNYRDLKRDKNGRFLPKGS